MKANSTIIYFMSLKGATLMLYGKLTLGHVEQEREEYEAFQQELERMQR